MRQKRIDAIEATMRNIKFSEKIKQKSIRAQSRIPLAEKPYSRDLNEMGKKSYFEEYFNGVKLENQILPKVGPFENPRETQSFKKGYVRGSEIVATSEKLNNINLIPVEYREEAQKRFTK